MYIYGTFKLIDISIMIIWYITIIYDYDDINDDVVIFIVFSTTA